jgi:pilus assembly protein CpaE
MRPQTNASVVLDDQVDRAVVEMVLSSSPQLQVTDYRELGQAEQANGDGGDALIVACAAFSPAVGDYVREARRLHPERPVLLVCTSESNGYVSEAISSGVEDVVTVPFDADPRLAQAMSNQLVFTVEKALARKREERAITSETLGRMICVLGLKGGGGKTLTSTNLAASLADAGHSVALVDLDLQFGDIGLTLGMSP